jgi:glycosyltransferase involved in cell wall biosynthesis
MKIAIDARLYGLENAGIGRYTIELINCLAKDSSNEYFILLRSKYFKSLKLPNNFHKIEVEIPHYSLKEQRQIPKILNKINPDLTHFLHFNVPLTYKGKFIVTIHDSIMHSSKGKNTSKQPFYKYYFKRIAYRRIFSFALKKSVKIIVPSQCVKKQIEEKFRISGGKIVVTHEGVGTEFITKKYKNLSNKYNIKNKYFIYTGSAYPHKNLHKAIESIVQLNESQLDKVNLLIVGKENKFMEDMRAFVEKFKAEGAVKFLGFVDDSELKSLYHYSTGFLYPSVEEGFGLPGLEAMSSGTIVLSSDIPVFREIYDSAAIFFDPLSVGSMVDSMKKVLAFTTVEREKQIALSYKVASRYSWEEMTKKIINVYNAV